MDGFGHISVRHPDNPQRFLLSRARAPDCIEADDIMEFTLRAIRSTREAARPISSDSSMAALYEARPDVHSVVHNHRRA